MEKIKSLIDENSNLKKKIADQENQIKNEIQLAKIQSKIVNARIKELRKQFMTSSSYSSRFNRFLSSLYNNIQSPGQSQREKTTYCFLYSSTRHKRNTMMMIQDYYNKKIDVSKVSRCEMKCVIEGFLDFSPEYIDMMMKFNTIDLEGMEDPNSKQMIGKRIHIGKCSDHNVGKKFIIEEEGGSCKGNKTYDKVHSIEDI